MNKTFLKVSMLLFALVFVASCSSDDDGPAEAPTVKFRASISGQNVRTDNVSGVLSNNGGRLTIIANTDIGSVTIRVGSEEIGASAITDQTYVISDTGTAEVILNSGGSVYTSNADIGGEIIISSIDLTQNTVFGSFSATIVNSLDDTDTITITNGALFNVNFTVQ